MMELGRKTLVATLLAGVVALADLGAARAGDFSPAWKTMRPLYAVSFDIGRKHVLSYYLRKNDLCDLTVMVTDRPKEPPEGDEIPPLHSQRFAAAIDVGTIARFDTTEGTSLEYACKSEARAMEVRQVKRIAESSQPAN